MNIEVLGKNHEALMHRTSFKATVTFTGKTPSRVDMIKDLCAKLSSKENLTIINRIDTEYGAEKALLSGFVYDDESKLNALENKFTKLRHLTKAEQKAEKDKAKAAKQVAAAAKKKK
jgi:ribosomal protein S24E